MTEHLLIALCVTVCCIATIAIVEWHIHRAKREILSAMAEYQSATHSLIAQGQLKSEAVIEEIKQAAVETVKKPRTQKPGTIAAFRNQMMARSAGIDE